METLQRTANRGSISTGYDIDNSCKFEDDNDEWLYRTNVSGTNAKTWTLSWWFKQTELRSVNGAAAEHWRGGAYGEGTRAGIDVNDRLWIDIGGGDGNTGSLFRSLSNQLIRDTSAWYHVVIACDSTQSTEADRLKVWLNGVEITSWYQHQIPTLNFASALAGYAGIQMNWGSGDATYHGYSGYLAECNYLDGVTATQNDFGEFDDDSGIWKPKEYTGSYGTNGTYLDFADASNLGDDESGNGNDYTLNNITSADQSTDTPTNNFCTWNPLWVYQYQPIISEGATKVRYDDSTDEGAKATIGLTNGKWYWEAKPVGTIGSQYIGIQTDGDDNIASGQSQLNDYTMTINPTGRYYSYAGSLSESAAGQFTSLTTSDWLGIALDMDSATQTIKYYVNGSLILTRDLISEMQGKTVFPFLQNYENRSWDINFGGYTINTISSAASDEEGYGTFEYAPPSGYYAICTKNLAEYG